MMKPAGPAFECIILCVADGSIFGLWSSLWYYIILVHHKVTMLVQWMDLTLSLHGTLPLTTCHLHSKMEKSWPLKEKNIVKFLILAGQTGIKPLSQTAAELATVIHASVPFSTTENWDHCWSHPVTYFLALSTAFKTKQDKLKPWK